MSVIFEEEQNATGVKQREVTNYQTGSLEQWLIKIKIAKNERDAAHVLVLVAILFFVISAILFSVTFVKRTNNYLDDRPTGNYVSQTPAKPAQ